MVSIFEYYFYQLKHLMETSILKGNFYMMDSNELYVLTITIQSFLNPRSLDVQYVSK
jgi:hypothetical protein